MRLKKVVVFLAALATVTSLAACGQSQPSAEGSGDGGGNRQPQEQAQGQGGQAQQQGQQDQGQQEDPQRMTDEAREQQVAPDGGGAQAGGEGQIEFRVPPPDDKTLKLTVPKMAEIQNDTIPSGQGTDEALFHDYAGVRLLGTGFPWQQEANVYIAGHRLGFPNTDSDHAFYDLEDLRNGDEVYVTDAMGREYTYEVFNKLVVEPTDLSVLERQEGKNILSLQTCTLPDYSDRVIYQAELKDIKEA